MKEAVIVAGARTPQSGKAKKGTLNRCKAG